MKIGGKDKKLKQKTTNVHEPNKPATNGTISAMSKDELTEKMEDLIKPKFGQNEGNPDPEVPPKYEDIDEKVGFSPDEIAEKMEDLIKPKFDQNGAAIPDHYTQASAPKYEEVDDLQKENSDKSSDTVVLADVHVSE